MRLCPKLDRFQVPRDEPLTFLHSPQEARETPMSSSCGRPFDHISIHALIGASQENYVSHPTPKPTSRISSKSLDRTPRDATDPALCNNVAPPARFQSLHGARFSASKKLVVAGAASHSRSAEGNLPNRTKTLQTISLAVRSADF